MDIQVDELKDKFDAEESFCLIDVREQHEHEAFNVGGKLIPLGELPTQLESLAEFKETEVVLYCRSGARSGIAKRVLEMQGFSNVRNLLGGMLEWERKFGPTK